MLYNFMFRSILIMAVLASSSNVLSKEISYDYIEGARLSTSGNNPSANGDGFEFSGSLSVMPNIAITAGYGQMEFDVDNKMIDLGVTAHTSTFAPGASLFVNFSIVEATAKTTSKDDTGYAVSAGLRSMVTDIFEIDAEFSRVDLFDDHDTSFSFAGRFYISEKLSYGIGYIVARDSESVKINARVDF